MELTFKIKRTLWRATFVTSIIFAVSVAIQLYVAKWRPVVEPPGASQYVGENEPSPPPSQTIWETMRDDQSISYFVKILKGLPDIIDALNSVNGKFTVYAPTDSAFEIEQLPPNEMPIFGYTMLAIYHMGFGAFSQQSLLEKNTMATFLHADRFFKYKQRISTQPSADGLSVNFRAKPIGPEVVATNGYIHRIDRVLTIPDAVSVILRENSEFSTFRAGLIQTNIAVVVNDTSSHDGQTVFVATNTAFKKLGKTINRFLFSRGGATYLEALLKYHIVTNRTIFTDVYYQAQGEGEIIMSEGSTTLLPTLVQGHDLHVSIDTHTSRKSITINDAVRTSTQDIVAMDGVVHAIDTILLPPMPSLDNNGETETEALSWMGSLFGMIGPQKLTVEGLIERLNPLLEG